MPNGEPQPCLVSMVSYAIQNGYTVIDQKELDAIRSGLKSEAVEGQVLKPEPVGVPVEPSPPPEKKKSGARTIKVGGL